MSEPMDMAVVGIGTLMVALAIILVFSSEREKRVRKRIDRIKQSNKPPTQQELIKQSLRRAHPQSGATSSRSFGEWLYYRLEFGGVALTVKKYVIYNLVLFLVVSLVVLVFVTPSILLAVLTGFALGTGLPHLYVGSCIKRRKKKFIKLFPDALDLIVRGLRAGLPAAKSMQSVAAEVPEPVSSVFREITEQIMLGVTMEKALADMAKRLGMTEFDFFVTSITLQRETGGNLTEILSNLSEVLRQRMMMRLKIKALSSEARASAIIVGSLPFLVFGAVSVMSPDYMRPLFEDSRGNVALIGSFASLGLGIFIMIRMAKFEI